MSWRAWRHGGHWQIGWSRGRWWFALAGGRDMHCLDIGTWRIRWAGRDFHPLFSERYGYTPVHKIGRLAAIHTPRRKKR